MASLVRHTKLSLVSFFMESRSDSTINAEDVERNNDK